MNAEHEALVGRIRSSAAAVADAVRAVPPGTALDEPLAGEWSVQEALVHTRNVVVLVLGLRIRRLLYERDPLFADYDDGPVRRENLCDPEPLDQVLEMILAEHAQIAALLSRLPDADWQRSGRHLERGPMSIELLARWAADHAEDHAGQIARTVAAMPARRGAPPANHRA